MIASTTHEDAYERDTMPDATNASATSISIALSARMLQKHRIATLMSPVVRPWIR